MALRTIRTIGDELLYQKSREVKKMTPRTQTLIEDMLETMYDAQGVGLAAPQVGVLKRIVVIDVSPEGDQPIILINPEIIEKSGEQTGYEGCLSVPGKTGIVTRANYCKVKALNENMEEIVVEGEELLARAFQHEIAHLDGQLYVSLVEGELMNNSDLEEQGREKIMKDFLDKDFLLESDAAKKLFHEYAEKMPICDYHCHLSPKEIYENNQPNNISDLWLSGDHYKWRAMRSCGVEEKYCTGDASPKEKFEKFAYTLQYCIGNPLYHWAHIELQRYFGIDTPLNAKTADDIYERANKAIANGDFAPQSLITKSNVKVVCTTDDPVDDLKYHKLLKNVDGFDCKVLPTFRPDKALNIHLDGFADYIKELGEVSGVEIKTVDDVICALLKRVEYFHSVGCRVSDQAFDCPPYAPASKDEVNAVFNKAMNGEKLTDYECNVYKTPIVIALGEKYHELGWTMEVHIGAMRNNNTLMFNKIGADTGFDSVGDDNIAKPLSRLLDALNINNKLPKTILFNLNDKDNIVLATMLGNFQSSDAESKIQFGPAWWFLDTMDGMTAQMKSLANLGVLGKFVGMETDSRSFTSYGRHEYFRRIMCNLIGSWVEKGMYAYDEDILKEIVEGISYNNAIKYFNFE